MDDDDEPMPHPMPEFTLANYADEPPAPSSPLQRLYSVERKTHVPAEFVPLNNRVLIVDWLLDSACYYRLRDEVAHLAVAVLDSFWASQPWPRARELWPCDAAAAFLVAAKIDVDTQSPQPWELAQGAVFSDADVKARELELLNALHWQVSDATAVPFLRLYADKLPLPHQQQLARQLCDASLYRLDICAAFLPSCIAASAVLAATSHACREPNASDECARMLLQVEAAARKDTQHLPGYHSKYGVPTLS